AHCNVCGSCGEHQETDTRMKIDIFKRKEASMHRGRWLVVTALFVAPIAFAQGQARPIVIRASTVLDGRGAVLRDVALVVEGTRIVRIDSNVSAPTYDLRGLTVMPGWIDTHTHIAAHFDRETGKVHSRQVNETAQQSMLYAMENPYNKFMAGF